MPLSWCAGPRTGWVGYEQATPLSVKAAGTDGWPLDVVPWRPNDTEPWCGIVRFHATLVTDTAADPADVVNVTGVASLGVGPGRVDRGALTVHTAYEQ